MSRVAEVAGTGASRTSQGMKRRRLPMLVALVGAGCVLGSEPVGTENESSGAGESTHGGSEGSASAGMTSTSSASEGATTDAVDTGNDTDGPAAACDMPSPNAYGGWALDLGDFPGADEPELDMAIACTITGVELDASQTMTHWQLACDDDLGVAHDVRFDVAMAHETPDGLAALVELPAELRVVGARDFGGVIADGAAAVELAVAQIALVGDGQLYGFVVEGPEITADVFAPLEITIDRDACGVDPDIDDPDHASHQRDMGIRFAIADRSLELFSGQWSRIEVDGGAHTDTITIDVLEATAQTCCHSDTWIRLVGRTYREYAPD